MPQIANITIKKNDGTTDVVYTAVVPSAGDKSPAVWRNLTVGTAAGHRPELRLTSRANGTGTARRMDGSFSYPALVTDTTGKTQVADRFNMQVTGVIPLGMPDADLNEAVAQALNIFAATLLKDSFKTGYAPT
jgi:hypothetical protein